MPKVICRNHNICTKRCKHSVVHDKETGTTNGVSYCDKLCSYMDNSTCRLLTVSELIRWSQQ